MRTKTGEECRAIGDLRIHRMKSVSLVLFDPCHNRHLAVLRLIAWCHGAAEDLDVAVPPPIRPAPMSLVLCTRCADKSGNNLVGC